MTVLLKPLLPDDASHDWVRHLEWLRDKENGQFIEARHWLGGVQSIKKSVADTWERGGWFWTIHYGVACIGTVKLDPWGHRYHGVYWIGILIGDAVNRGKGYATAAVERACELGGKGGARLALAGMYEGNAASRRLFEKCGFMYEATIGGGRLLDGQPVDHIVLARRLDSA